MKRLILSLLFPSCLLAEGISGIGDSEMAPQSLTKELSFSVISKDPTHTLHWKLAQGSSTVTAGEEVLPGEKYAYYWDPEKKVFWFATLRSISRMGLSGWTPERTVLKDNKIRTIQGFESDEELPAAFRENIRTILK